MPSSDQLKLLGGNSLGCLVVSAEAAYYAQLYSISYHLSKNLPGKGVGSSHIIANSGSLELGLGALAELGKIYQTNLSS